MRFIIRKGTKSWFVWDTSAGVVPVVDGLSASGLSAETGKAFADQLNSRR